MKTARVRLITFLLFMLQNLTLAQTQWPWLNPNVLAPAGLVAERINTLWEYLLVTASIVFVFVMTLVVIAFIRPGQALLKEDPAEHKLYPWFILGSVTTALILVATAIYTFFTLHALAAPQNTPQHTFEVGGKQWWWEISYAGETLGANELHIPVGETVAINLRSDNVIHSFWVPQLAGKRDLIPGKTNVLFVRADSAGIYRGFCAEFCGVQHALMGFVVIAESAPAFESWLERQRAPVNPAVLEQHTEAQAIFQNHGCAGCHTIRGTSALGKLGPDLTHLGSRLTLGAATLPNTEGHLGGWVMNAQALKPGNHMPSQTLAASELHSLLEYLQALD